MLSRVPCFLLLFASTPLALACTGADHAKVVAGLRVTQPLIASPRADDSVVIQVRSDGCVRVRYPSWDVRAGSYAFTLSARELARLRKDLAASRIADFSPDAVRADLARRASAKAGSAEPRYLTSDEEVLELVFEAPAGQAKASHLSLVWSGLRSQRLNHPDQPDLAALQAARDRLLGLAVDRRLTKSGS